MPTPTDWTGFVTPHQIAALGGLAGALIALLWIAFDGAREINASLNDQPINDGSDCFHGTDL